jgi:Zn-dependent protease
VENVDILHLVLTISFLVLSLGIHEAAHAWVAWQCGDSTARDLGRMTLNPVAHIDPFMTLILPAVLYFTTGFIFGGAKPVPVNAMRLRNPLRDMSLVALAGPASNFLLAVLFALAWKAMLYLGHMPREALAVRVMESALFLNLLLAAFNMLPIPPLDGSRVMAYLLPGGIRDSYVALERFGMIIVFLFLMTRAMSAYLNAALDPMYGAVDFLTGGVWA